MALTGKPAGKHSPALHQFARALQSPPFAWLWAGQTIPTLGNGAYLTALAWQVLLLTHSDTAMGLVLMANIS
jgi:hypothetical protein